MDTPSPLMRDLAQRLLALETASQFESGPKRHEGIAVSEKLRISLTRFVGADGFTALLRRALALARADVPLLETVKLSADGRLEGIEDLAADAAIVSKEGATAITAHLLGLMATFIGESLTLRLVREAWPDLPLDE